MMTPEEIAANFVSENGAVSPRASAAMMGFQGDLEILIADAIKFDRSQKEGC